MVPVVLFWLWRGPYMGGGLREFLPLLMPLYNPAVMARVGAVSVELILAGSLVGFAQPDTQD